MFASCGSCAWKRPPSIGLNSSEPSGCSKRVSSEVPLARGLGSSAAALVAGIVAANELLGRPLDDAEILDVAAREEGHPDNVAPALFGGIVVATLDKLGTHYVRLDPPANLGVTVLIPDFELSTSKAHISLLISLIEIIRPKLLLVKDT